MQKFTFKMQKFDWNVWVVMHFFGFVFLPDVENRLENNRQIKEEAMKNVVTEKLFPGLSEDEDVEKEYFISFISLNGYTS